jgi:hypothetical protein
VRFLCCLNILERSVIWTEMFVLFLVSFVVDILCKVKEDCGLILSRMYRKEVSLFKKRGVMLV